MDTIQFIVLIATLGGLFLWQRTESRSDFRLVMECMSAIQKETKDFHGRLCAIEARAKGVRLEDLEKGCPQ